MYISAKKREINKWLIATGTTPEDTIAAMLAGAYRADLNVDCIRDLIAGCEMAVMVLEAKLEIGEKGWLDGINQQWRFIAKM